MAVIVAKPTVQVVTTFTVTEEELRALDALAGYGTEPFLKMFYKDLGTAYMRPYEAGLREFLASVRNLAGPILRDADAARKAFNNN